LPLVLLLQQIVEAQRFGLDSRWQKARCNLAREYALFVTGDDKLQCTPSGLWHFIKSDEHSLGEQVRMSARGGWSKNGHTHPLVKLLRCGRVLPERMAALLALEKPPSAHNTAHTKTR
jgi:hypothetical protein